MKIQKKPKTAKPKPRIVLFKGKPSLKPIPKAPKPAPAPAPAKSRLMRSDEKPEKPVLMTQKPVKSWYAVAVTYGFSDEKVRKALTRLKKTVKGIGRILSPKVEVEELKLVGKCQCPRELPPDDNLLPPPETPRGLKVRKTVIYPRRIGECTCPKIPTKVKRKKFPGYLILQAHLSQEVLSGVHTTKGVEMILMGKGNIVAVDSEEAAVLLLERQGQNAEKKEKVIPTTPTFKAGDRVKVIGDPKAAWYGQSGKVVECATPPNMTTKVEFTLLGQPVFATFDSRTLEKEVV